VSETLFPSEEDLQRASRSAAGGDLSRRVTVDDALASFGSEGEPRADVRQAAPEARTGPRPAPPIERKLLGAEIVLPADPPIAPAQLRRPRLLMMLRIAAAVVLGALLGLSYERYRLASSPATTAVESESSLGNPAASVPTTSQASASAADAPPPVPEAQPSDSTSVRRTELALSANRSASRDIDAALPRAAGTLPSTAAAPGGIVPATGPSPDERAADPADLEETSVRKLVNAYAHAYDRLDAVAVSALWPNVDRQALSSVFDSVSSQRVTLDNCDITVTGERATAQCAGGIDFIPRVGDPRPQSRNIDWTFDLRRSSGQWRIAEVNAK
jgi:hypothetical protein